MGLPLIIARGFPGKRLDWYLAGINANMFILIFSGLTQRRKDAKGYEKSHKTVFLCVLCDFAREKQLPW
jgi:hypothetical protein